MNRSIRKCLPPALYLGLSVLALPFAAMPAAAQLVDDGRGNPFKDVLGLITVNINPFEREKQTEAPIEYRERAPLVLPPKMDLPSPQASAGERNAAWPVDSDLIKRRKAQAEARKPQAVVPKYDRELTKQELLAGRNDNYETGSATPPHVPPDNNYAPMRQIQQIDADNARKDAQAVALAGEEPDRAYLTEPPKGYRKPTKVVKIQSEGQLAIQKEQDSSVWSFFKTKSQLDD